ncbi:MAG: hypothetical protein WC823_03765 [Parcubacteria group bacterium]|jgi:hypothetical protein
MKMKKIDKNTVKSALQYIGALVIAIVPVYLLSSKAKQVIDQQTETAHNKTQTLSGKIKSWFQGAESEDASQSKSDS